MVRMILKTAAGRVGVLAGGLVVAAAVWVGLGGSLHAAPPPPDPETCVPTCEIDGRSLVSAGNDQTTLSAQEIVLGLSFTEAAGPDGNFAFYDGDRDQTNWDVLFNCGNGCPGNGALAPQLIIELYADAAGQGGSGPAIAVWTPGATPGIPDATEKGSFPTTNNDWAGVTFTHDPAALNATNYQYALRIRPQSPDTDKGWNAFKVRANGTILLLGNQVVGFIAAMNVPNDLATIYPSYPSLTPTVYDGTWVFRTKLPPFLDDVTVYDGDMDFGAPNCAYNDTDDPDSVFTPVSPGDVLGIPPFANGSAAVPEGVAVANPGPSQACPNPPGGLRTGTPAEDNASAGFRRQPTIVPNGIAYQLKAPATAANPSGQFFLNQNPSGNKEWEQFKIQLVDPGHVTRGACPGPSGPSPGGGYAEGEDGYPASDCRTTDLPGGVWEIHLDGMDLSNLNFWFFTGKSEPPPTEYSIGRRVWFDTNGDGVEDPGEPGAEGVTYTVSVSGSPDPLLPDGTIVRSNQTGLNGVFSEVGLGPGKYSVVIDAANFAPGGVLEGFTSTTGGETSPASGADTATDDGIEVGLPVCTDTNVPAGCGQPLYDEWNFGYDNPPPAPFFIVIDEDSIDNGVPPNNFTAVEVNEQLATVGLRAILPRFNNTDAGDYIGTELTLFTGETTDHGWFSVPTILQSWADAGPTTDGLRNFVGMPGVHPPGPGLGTGPDPEALLDKIPDVTPWNAAMLYASVGSTFCAVVYDGSISINTNPQEGSLKGANLGIVAFQVLEVTDNTGQSSTTLPKVRLVILDAAQVCSGPLNNQPIGG